MPHFFISYAKTDTRALASALRDGLNAVDGVTAWADLSLRAGQSWELQIQSEIDRCDFMVVLYSPDINRHKHGEDESYVLTEIAYAKFTARKPIIPVMVQRTDPPISLTTAHYIDFTLPNLTLDELIIDICDEVGIQGAPTFAVSTASSSVQPAAPTLGDRATDSKGITMVFVPSGILRMGMSDDQVEQAITQAQQDYPPNGADIFSFVDRETFDDELPQHQVPITESFWLDLTPVTNQMYGQFVRDGGYSRREFWTIPGWEWVQRSKLIAPVDRDEFNAPWQPRINITWYEAYAYAQWRGGRLPTEAEWEWAARGPENHLYAWGNTFDEKCAVYRWNSGGKTAPVGSSIREKGASWVGALDMCGNVWEWVNTPYRSYPYPTENGRESSDDMTESRVMRGGSWSDYPHVLRTTTRAEYDSDIAIVYVGFRVAREAV